MTSANQMTFCLQTVLCNKFLFTLLHVKVHLSITSIRKWSVPDDYEANATLHLRLKMFGFQGLQSPVVIL